MCLNHVWAKKAQNKKRVGQGGFKHMIYLPLPFCRKKRFWPNMVETHDLPKKAQKTKVDQKLAPPLGLNT